MSPFSLEGKVAIVTGGSRGIGAAIATRLAEAGAAVVISARKPDELNATASALEAKGARVLAVTAHAGKAADVQNLVDTAVEKFGKVDVLVNNAATNPYFGPLMEIEDGAWDKTFEVNLKGYFLATRAVARHLTGRDAKGSIVNVASIVGLRGAPMQGAYGMTKAAVISMTLTLAQELGGAGIRVNAIAPGLVDTRFAAAIVSNPEFRTGVEAKTALGRIAGPDEIAGAAVYLASDAASYVTGHVLVVDGGTTITGF